MPSTIYQPVGPNRPRIMLNLECTRSCSYCTLPCSYRTKDLFVPLTPDGWILRFRQLRAMGYGSEPTLGGMEPFLYEGFVELVNKLEQPASVYTNLDVPLDPKTMNPDRLAITVTFHRGMSVEQTKEFVSRFLAFRRRGFHIGVDALGISAANKLILRKNKIAVREKAWVEKPAPPPGPVRCTYHVPWFAPDGSRWHCTSKMLLGDTLFRLSDGYQHEIRCADPTCNGCDWINSTSIVRLEESQ